jgi:DNA-binding transcriptional LysR family regulator
MESIQFDFALISALDALLQERNVSRAAERTGLSQPAMSRSLRRLRNLFRDELLVRVGREYYLTSFAEALVEPVDEIHKLVRATVERRPSFDPQRDRQTFSIAASDYVAFLLLKPLAASLAVEAPGLTLRTRGLSEETFHELEAGHLDFVIANRPPEERVPGQLLFTDRWLCAVALDNPEVGAEISLDQYLSFPHVTYSSGATRPYPGELALAHLGRSQRNVVTIDSFFLLPFFLPGTRYVALVPERTGARLAEFANIRLLETPFQTDPVRIYISWHPRSTDNPAHRWLRDRIAEISSDL